MSLAVLENYLSREEFAKEVGKDVRTVIRWELQRRAPKRTKIGRSVYYSKRAVEQWLSEQEERQ